MITFNVRPVTRYQLVCKEVHETSVSTSVCAEFREIENAERAAMLLTRHAETVIEPPVLDEVHP